MEVTDIVPEHFFIRNNGRFQKIALADILYFEASGAYTRIVTVASTYVIVMNISEVESRMPSDRFHRIHHSYLVAVNRINVFDRFQVTMENGQVLPVAARRQGKLETKVYTLTKS